MTAIERRIIETFKELVSEKFQIVETVLFGSRARGDADLYSDMDILVTLDTEISEETDEYIAECAWRAGFTHGIIIVPIVYSNIEWRNGIVRNSLLAKAVESEGIRV